MTAFDYLSQSPEETITLGRRIGENLQGGEVFAINGTLGTGKTHLIKGISDGAGAPDPQQVSSPTFVLINEYEGRLLLYHLDAYRLDSVEQFEQLGFDDLLSPDAVVLIEWANRVESALLNVPCIHVTLSHVDASARHIALSKIPAHLQKNSLFPPDTKE